MANVAVATKKVISGQGTFMAFNKSRLIPVSISIFFERQVKGHLISKCLFGVIVSTKIVTKIL